MSSHKQSVLLLITRLILGGIFIYTGWLKVSAIADTIGFFQSLGIPAFMAYVVGYLELIGGILVVLGLYIDIASAILAIIMVFAIYFTFAAGFQAFGTPLVVFAGLFALIAAGAGKFAVRLPKKN